MIIWHKLNFMTVDFDAQMQYFLAPTGALEEGMLSVRVSVRPFLQKNIEN